MKILQINSICGIRSTGRICTDIAVELEKQGHVCKIAYGRETVPEKHQKYAVRIGNDPNTKIDGLKSRLFDNAGFNSRRATKRFLKWVKEYDPDVIHLHNIHGYYINVELLFQYLKEAGKPVVWTFHDCWPFTGHCAYFDFVKCEKWRGGCHHCPLTRAYPANYGYDHSIRNYAKKKACFMGVHDLTIVTPSKWLADIVKESFLGGYDVQVVPNGIDTTIFKPTEGDFREQYGLKDKQIVLGVASPWSKRKGLADFLQLAEKLPDNYRVVLVGLSQTQRESLPENVIGITRTDNAQQLAEIYSAADIFVNPTYEDNYPTVNLEAQACGTPVITYHTGGSVESVPPEQVVEKGDVEALCRAVINLEQCKVREVDYSAQTSFRNYVQMYQSKTGEEKQQ